MMAADTLYRLLEDQCVDFGVDPDGPEHVLAAVAVFRFAEDYPGFSGHFPGNPVLPAIVQLAMVRYTAGRAAGRELKLVSYAKTKFKNIIRPEEPVQVELRIEEGKGQLAGSFRLSIAGDTSETVATGNCLFADT